MTLIIRYADRFEAYLPKYHTNDGFPIKGGEGYIINVTAGKDVDFTGTVWDNTNAAPSRERSPSRSFGTTWAFVVAGTLPIELSDSDKLTVTVNNVDRNIRSSPREIGSHKWLFRILFPLISRGECSPSHSGNEMGLKQSITSHSEFCIAFVNPDRHAVVEAGDHIEIAVRDTRGRLLTKQRITIEPSNLINAFAFVNLSYNPIPHQTILLQNFPNPFNPETWIPLKLSRTAKVDIYIWDASGELVRIFELGQMEVGSYLDKESAVSWNGRNNRSMIRET